MSRLARRASALAVVAALAALGWGTAATSVGGAGPPAHATGAAAEVRVFLSRDGQTRRCDRVFGARRTVAAPAVLAGVVRALLRGPTASERRRGYGGWFSPRTAGMLRGVRLSGGVALIDFRDFRRIIPGASSSCGSALLLAQLDRTATQFPTVRRAVYSFNGSRRAFYEWIQRSPPRG